jgi:TPR repeat protein
MVMGFASATGRAGLEVSCSSALQSYKQLVETRLANSQCVASGDECYAKIVGSNKHFMLLPAQADVNAAGACAVQQLSHWEGAPRDCSRARPGKENLDCKRYLAAVNCFSTHTSPSEENSASELMIKGFILATGRGLAANLTAAAEILQDAQLQKESYVSYYNLGELLSWQGDMMSNRLDGEHRSRALKVMAAALVQRAVAKATKDRSAMPVLLMRAKAQLYSESECEQGLQMMKQTAEHISGVGLTMTIAQQQAQIDPEHSLLRWMEAAEQGVAVAQCKLGSMLFRSRPMKAMQVWSMAAEQGDPCGQLELAQAQINTYTSADKLPGDIDSHVTSLLCGVLCGPGSKEQQERAVSLLHEVIAHSPDRGSSRECNTSNTGLLLPKHGPCDRVVSSTQSWGGFRYVAVLLLSALLGAVYLQQSQRLKFLRAQTTSTEPSPYSSQCASPARPGAVAEQLEIVGRGVLLNLPWKKLDLYGFSTDFQDDTQDVSQDVQEPVPTKKSAANRKTAKRAAKHQRAAGLRAREEAKRQHAEQVAAAKAAEEEAYLQALQEAAALAKERAEAALMNVKLPEGTAAEEAAADLEEQELANALAISEETARREHEEARQAVLESEVQLLQAEQAAAPEQMVDVMPIEQAEPLAVENAVIDPEKSFSAVCVVPSEEEDKVSTVQQVCHSL